MDGLLLIVIVIMASCAVIGSVVTYLVLSLTGKLDPPPCACAHVLAPGYAQEPPMDEYDQALIVLYDEAYKQAAKLQQGESK